MNRELKRPGRSAKRDLLKDQEERVRSTKGKDLLVGTKTDDSGSK